jgi:hypothetical protein
MHYKNSCGEWQPEQIKTNSGLGRINTLSLVSFKSELDNELEIPQLGGIPMLPREAQMVTCGIK